MEISTLSIKINLLHRVKNLGGTRSRTNVKIASLDGRLPGDQAIITRKEIIIDTVDISSLTTADLKMVTGSK